MSRSRPAPVADDGMPSGARPLRASVQAAVDLLRQAISGANVLAAFEAGMDLAGRLPPDDGAAARPRRRGAVSNVVATLRKVA